MKNLCIDGVEGDVAGGGVNGGVEVGEEGDGVFADVELEVGHVGGSVGGDGAEGPGEVTGRGEGAGDAVNAAEVSLGELVLAVESGVAGVVVLPGAEVALGDDVADGFGVGEDGVVGEGTFGADVLEGEGGYVEDERVFAGRAGLEDDFGVGADDLIDQDADAGLAFLFGVVGHEVGVMLAGWDVDLHALHVDGEDAGGGFEELADSGAELEAADGEHGGRGDGGGVGFGGAGEVEDAESVPGDLEAVGYGDVEVIEFDGAVETGGEALDDAVFQHRLGVMS